MATNSRIEWTETTWNPVTGCTKISPGCEHCYAERMAKRLQAMGSPNYRYGFKTTCHSHLIRSPLSWKKSRVVFVNSMSDLFHEDVPDSFVKKIFRTMSQAKQHCFQVLTKRSQRLRKMSSSLIWTENTWAGVSVENSDYLSRIDDLRQTAASVKFLSLEPLLAPLADLDLRGIDWVIVGGESGPGARPMKKEWVIDIRNQCERAGIPFFFKQWGGINKKKKGRLLEGKTWDDMPKRGPCIHPPQLEFPIYTRE
jgi:protein gp37